MGDTSYSTESPDPNMRCEFAGSQICIFSLLTNKRELFILIGLYQSVP